MIRRHRNRPRIDMNEWDECCAATVILRLRYALWLMLWHQDEEGPWGDMLVETRRPGYDGELHYGT